MVKELQVCAIALSIASKVSPKSQSSFCEIIIVGLTQ